MDDLTQGELEEHVENSRFAERLLAYVEHNQHDIYVRAPGTKKFSELTGAEAIHFIRLWWGRRQLPSIVRAGAGS